MNFDDFWIVKYKTGLITRSFFYVIAPYDQYDAEKIKKNLNETEPELEIIKIYKVKKPKQYGG